MYCSSCAPYTALMPRTGPATGYDAALVCSFCIEPLTSRFITPDHSDSELSVHSDCCWSDATQGHAYGQVTEVYGGIQPQEQRRSREGRARRYHCGCSGMFRSHATLLFLTDIYLRVQTAAYGLRMNNGIATIPFRQAKATHPEVSLHEHLAMHPHPSRNLLDRVSLLDDLFPTSLAPT
jgi:hypothetical protein